MKYLACLTFLMGIGALLKALCEQHKERSHLKNGLKGKLAEPDDYYAFRENILRHRIGTEYYGNMFFVVLNPHLITSTMRRILAEMSYPDIIRLKSDSQNNIILTFVHEGLIYRICFQLDVSVWLSGEMPDRQRREILADISSYLNAYQKMTRTQRIVRAAEDDYVEVV